MYDNDKLGPNVLGAVEVAENLALMPLRRRAYQQWGATEADLCRRLPGDELVPQPRTTYTRAINIEAPPCEVWAWLVQIGQGRGGFYSYDGLENLAGCDIHSVDSINPALQTLAVGDEVRLGPEGFPAFRVAEIIPEHALVLLGGEENSESASTWQFYLEPCCAENGTRLIVRGRLTYEANFAQALMWQIIEPINFVMEKKMLQGIKQRAEAAAKTK